MAISREALVTRVQGLEAGLQQKLAEMAQLQRDLDVQDGALREARFWLVEFDKEVS